MNAGRSREIRRHAGALAVGIGQLGLGEVCDPRSSRSRRWRLSYLLTVLVSGLAAGCRNLKEVERLTAQLSPAIRRRLHIFRRAPDTTLRDLLMLLPLGELRALTCSLVSAPAAVCIDAKPLTAKQNEGSALQSDRRGSPLVAHRRNRRLPLGPPSPDHPRLPGGAHRRRHGHLPR